MPAEVLDNTLFFFFFHHAQANWDPLLGASFLLRWHATFMNTKGVALHFNWLEFLRPSSRKVEALKSLD